MNSEEIETLKLAVETILNPASSLNDRQVAQRVRQLMSFTFNFLEFRIRFISDNVHHSELRRHPRVKKAHLKREYGQLRSINKAPVF